MGMGGNGKQVNGNGNYLHSHGYAFPRKYITYSANGHVLMLLKLTFLVVIITDDDYLWNILQLGY